MASHLHYAEACSSGVQLQDGLEPQVSLKTRLLLDHTCKVQNKVKLYAGNLILMTICFLYKL